MPASATELRRIIDSAEKDEAHPGHYIIPSSESSEKYRVTVHGCTCKGWAFRGEPCKHMQAVIAYGDGNAS